MSHFQPPTRGLSLKEFKEIKESRHPKAAAVISFRRETGKEKRVQSWIGPESTPDRDVAISQIYLANDKTWIATVEHREEVIRMLYKRWRRALKNIRELAQSDRFRPKGCMFEAQQILEGAMLHDTELQSALGPDWEEDTYGPTK